MNLKVSILFKVTGKPNLKFSLMTHIILCITFLTGNQLILKPIREPIINLKQNNLLCVSFLPSTNSFGAHRCISVKGPFCGFIWLFMIHNGFKCSAVWRMNKLNGLVYIYIVFYQHQRYQSNKNKITCGERIWRFTSRLP